MIAAEKGLTLAEILIAMSVITVLLLGISVGNAVIHQSADAAFQRTRALQDAHQVMEAVRQTAKTGNFPSSVVAAFPNAATVSGYSSLPGETIAISYSDFNGDGNATNDNPLDITVTVTWLSNGTRSSTVSLRNLVTQG